MKRLILLASLLAACAGPNAELPRVDVPASYVEKAQGLGESAVKAAAAAAYGKAKENRLTLDHGPCLTDELVRGIALDIVHEPRIPADDRPENQCPSVREGGRKVLELDPSGTFLRIR